MSIDSYFCFCCLSTNELTNLFNNNSELNYVMLLENLFAIKPSLDFEDDSYICGDCITRLKSAYSFKNQTLETLNVLQMNGLIDICKVNGEVLVQRVNNDTSDIEKDKVKNDSKHEIQIIFTKEDAKQETKETQGIKAIKQEGNLNNVENIQIQGDSSITRQIIANDPVKSLKKDACIEKRRTVESYEVTDDLTCRICDKKFASLYMYHKHMNEHYPNHVCDVCGKGYLTEKRLKRHMKSHDTGPFHCKECSAVFNNRNTHYAHVQRVHVARAQYACPAPACGARFPSLARRAAHRLAAHAHRAPHACALCPRTFHVSGNLSAHIRLKHLKVKRHFCKECNASYFNKDDLDGHMVTHTGQKLFQCTVCSKSYPRKKSLAVHMRTHTDDKRFCCDACGRKFTQKCTLLSHMKTHARGD